MELSAQPFSLENLLIENDLLNQLRQETVTFTTPRSWLFRWLGAEERPWRLSQPYLGTLAVQLGELIHLDLPTQAVEVTEASIAVELTQDQAHRCARMLAIAVLDKYWLCGFLTRPLAYYFRQRLTPTQLVQLTGIVCQQLNLPAFLTAVRLWAVAPRKTQPSPEPVAA